MNTPKTGLCVASLLLALVAVAHLARLFLHLRVQIGDCDIGSWPSAVTVVLAAVLSVWFGVLSRHAASAPPADAGAARSTPPFP